MYAEYKLKVLTFSRFYLPQKDKIKEFWVDLRVRILFSLRGPFISLSSEFTISSSFIYRGVITTHP